MARNNPKPTDKLDWIPDDTTNILEPLPSVKATGWLFGQKPPNTSFNFITNLTNRLTDYFAAQVQDWIVIDSDADEGDYATLAAYIADTPAAADRILVKEDQTVTAQVVLPDDITIKFLDGARLLCATNIATSVLKLGSNPVIEGVLNIVLSQTGTTAKAVEIDGDNVVGKINVENSSTGTLTTGYHINANKTGNRVEGFIDNTGGGTLTNIVIDNSTEDSNLLIIVDKPNNQIIRSKGSNTFFDGFKFKLGSDADGDIYYQDAGILKRLAKGANDTYLRLIGGIPSWSDVFVGTVITNDAVIASGGIQTDGTNILKTKIVPIGVWDMNALASKSISTGVAHGDIRAINAIIKHDAGTHNYDLNYDNGNGSAGIPNGAECSTTSVELYRVTGGFFDSTTFSATSFTIDNAAAVDKGAGLVGIPITGHVYNANDSTIISGTTNYDGLYDIVSKTANEIVIAAPFIPETFAGAETVSWNRGWVAITYVS